jgi:hypothetical protein
VIAYIHQTTGHDTEAPDVIAAVMPLAAVIPFMIRPPTGRTRTSTIPPRTAAATCAGEEIVMFKHLFDGCSLAQQILHGRDGTGLEASAHTRWAVKLSVSKPDCIGL